MAASLFPEPREPSPDQVALSRWIRADVAPKRADALLREYGPPANVFSAGRSAWKRFECTDAEAKRLEAGPDPADLAMLSDPDITVLGHGMPEYPETLAQAVGAPSAFYCVGCMPEAGSLYVGIAGTRRASPYGLSAAEFFGREMGRAGAVIVTGGSHGIESLAMRSAMDAGGRCVVALPCGSDQNYPEDHARLFRHVSERGAVVSQFPPASRVLMTNFQKRNRFIAALCHAVILLEAPRESGCLTIVNYANEDGRQVFVLPGPYNASSFQANHDLIRLGATLTTNPFQVMDDLGQSYERKASPSPDVVLTTDQQSLLRLFDTHPKRLDEIARLVGKPAPLVAADLTYLELAGRLSRAAGGTFCRKS